MKRFWATVAVLIVIIGVFLLVWTKKATPQNARVSSGVIPASRSNNPAVLPTNATESTSTVASSTTAIAAASVSGAASPGAVSNEIAAPALPPLTVLDHARVVIHNYCSVFGENPVGTNPEITATLMGKNPKNINFITPESGLRVNDKGEMVDAWGTPFFFHQLSGKVMEIRSAGQDRKMWTFDDLVTR